MKAELQRIKTVINL